MSNPGGFIPTEKYLVHKLLYTEEAKKQISKLDQRLKFKMKEACQHIAQDPTLGKPLTRELKGRFSYHIGGYRVIYRVYQAEVVVLVLTIGHRRDVYEKEARKSR